MVSGRGWALLIVNLSLLVVIGGALDGALNFPLFSFIYFLSLSLSFLASLQIWCLHSNPQSASQSLFYVLCMFSPLIGTHGCKPFLSVKPPNFSPPCLSSPCASPTPPDSHVHKTPHIESSVRFECRSPQGT